MAATTRPIFEGDHLWITGWSDPIVDLHGVDVRSHYVEHVWLGVLGPSTVWLLRRLVDGLDGQPDGYPLDLAETATALGLGGHGRNSPLAFPRRNRSADPNAVANSCSRGAWLFSGSLRCG